MPNCKSDQIINPKTGRCVKKTGSIGKQILGKDDKPKSLLPKKEKVKSPKLKKEKKLSKKKLEEKKMGNSKSKESYYCIASCQVLYNKKVLSDKDFNIIYEKLKNNLFPGNIKNSWSSSNSDKQMTFYEIFLYKEDLNKNDLYKHIYNHFEIVKKNLQNFGFENILLNNLIFMELYSNDKKKIDYLLKEKYSYPKPRTDIEQKEYLENFKLYLKGLPSKHIEVEEPLKSFQFNLKTKTFVDEDYEE